MNGAVRQEWALVVGVPRRVDEFAHLSPKDRPAATCLECKRPVIFKCGEVRSHYVSHLVANEECAAVSGEGAEHYNAKLHLASALGRADRVEVYRKCVRCDVVKGSARLRYGYDGVELEHTHPNRLRADVALISGGELVCVIEVYVSHRCEYEKVIYHDRAEIPCLELSARQALAWHPDKPLSPTAIYGIERWVCSGCEEAARFVDERNVAGDLCTRPQLQKPPATTWQGGGKTKHKVIGVQKLFFTTPPSDLPFEQPFVTLEYMEDELGGESLLRRLTVADSGKVIQVLHEARPPYDEQKSEGFKRAYLGYLEELTTAYGHVRKGKWQTFRKDSKRPQR